MNELFIHMVGGTPAVYVKIWSPAKSIYRSLLLTLDTGAATTTISRDVLHILGYNTQSKEKKRIITASSIEYTDEVTLEKFIIAGFELFDVKAYAHSFPQESYTGGVIGINVLSDFDLFVSFQRKILGLTKIN